MQFKYSLFSYVKIIKKYFISNLVFSEFSSESEQRGENRLQSVSWKRILFYIMILSVKILNWYSTISEIGIIKLVVVVSGRHPLPVQFKKG